MQERRFSKRCADCHQRTMRIDSVPYPFHIDHDGRKYAGTIPLLEVPKCSNCGAVSIDSVAEEAIDEAFRKEAKLLTRKQIRANRERLRLSQEEFASRLRVAAATVSRWETGAQIQQRSLDAFMRVFFRSESVRRMLGDDSQLLASGVADVGACCNFTN